MIRITVNIHSNIMLYIVHYILFLVLFIKCLMFPRFLVFLHCLENAIDCSSFFDNPTDVELWQVGRVVIIVCIVVVIVVIVIISIVVVLYTVYIHTYNNTE